MRKYIILFFLVIPFLFSCGDSQPEGFIPKDKMTNLLTEVHIADGSVMNISQAPDTLYKYTLSGYLALFKKYGVDTGDFRKSYKYYAGKPGEMGDIYDQVLKNIQAKTDSVNKLLVKQNTANKRAVPGAAVNQPGAAGHGQAPAQMKQVAPGVPTTHGPLRPNLPNRFLQRRARQAKISKDSLAKLAK